MADLMRVLLVRPEKKLVASVRIEATDKGFRKMLFGLRGASRRLGQTRLGVTEQQQAMVAISEFYDGAEGAPWAFQRDDGTLCPFLGPAVVYSDIGYGPASLAMQPATFLKQVQWGEV